MRAPSATLVLLCLGCTASVDPTIYSSPSPARGSTLALVGGRRLRDHSPTGETFYTTEVWLGRRAATGAVTSWDVGPSTDLPIVGAHLGGNSRTLVVAGCDSVDLSPYSKDVEPGLVVARATVDDSSEIGSWQAAHLPWPAGKQGGCPQLTRPALASGAERLYLVGSDDADNACGSLGLLDGVATDPEPAVEGLAGAALATASDTHLYVLGAHVDGEPLDTLWRAALDPDGRLASWTEQSELVDPPLATADAVGARLLYRAGQLYLVGATAAGQDVATTIHRSSLDAASGAASVFVLTAAVMPTGLPSETAAVVAGAELLLAGGIDKGGAMQASLWRAAIDDSGEVGPLEQLDTLLPAPVAGAAATVWSDLLP